MSLEPENQPQSKKQLQFYLSCPVRKCLLRDFIPTFVTVLIKKKNLQSKERSERCCAAQVCVLWSNTCDHSPVLGPCLCRNILLQGTGPTSPRGSPLWNSSSTGSCKGLSTGCDVLALDGTLKSRNRSEPPYNNWI